MDQQFPEQIERLFEPRFEIERLEPIDHDMSERKTNSIDGVANFITKLDSYSKEFKKESVQNAMVTYIDRLETGNMPERKELEKKLVAWNPDKDPQIIGDPFKTLFVFKLGYDTNEIDLTDKFSAFGEIEHVRIVRVVKGNDMKSEGKSRGYAFLVFKNESSVRRAYYDGNGTDIKGRKVLVDTERGRSVKNWRPRRLGGGLGGRTPMKPKVVKSAIRNSKISNSYSKNRVAKVNLNSVHNNTYHSRESKSQNSYGQRTEPAASGYGSRDYHHDRVQHERYNTRRRYGQSGSGYYNGYHKGRGGYGSSRNY